MANIKSYTDIEQSKRLSEILPVESADMWWAERYAGKVMLNGQYIVDKEPLYYPCLVKPSEGNYSQDIVKDIPCWSLAALLDILYQVKEIKHQRVTILIGIFAGKSWYMEFIKVENGKSVMLEYSKEFVDACYEMIVKLNELKML